MVGWFRQSATHKEDKYDVTTSDPINRQQRPRERVGETEVVDSYKLYTATVQRRAAR
jgi:hypothetical protein